MKPGYKETSVGVIPEDWEVKKLIEISTKITVGFVGTCEKFYTDADSGIPMIRTGNLKNGLIDLVNLKYVTEEFHYKNKKSSLHDGDVLIARHGSSGQAVLYQNIFNSCNCLNIIILSPNKKNISPVFLVNQINSSLFKKQIKSKTAGSTQGVVNTKEVAQSSFILPPLPEQEKIADILTTVDDKIESINKQIESATELKKGLMQKLFSEGIGHSSFKDSQVGKIPSSWDVKKLGEACSQITKKANGDFKCIELEHLEQNTGVLLGTDNSENKQSVKNTFKKDDILFCKLRPYLRKYYFSNFDGVCSSELVVMRSKSTTIPKFLYYIIQQDSFIDHVVSSSYGTKMPRTSWNIIKEFFLSIPPLQEQQQIASILTCADDKISVLKSKKESYLLLKKGLMQKLLTGEVRVKL